MTKLIRKINWL